MVKLQKYLPCFDYEIIKARLRSKIDYVGILWLLDTIIDNSNELVDYTDCFPGNNLCTPLSGRRAVTINYQTSQFLDDLYLSALLTSLRKCLGAVDFGIVFVNYAAIVFLLGSF